MRTRRRFGRLRLVGALMGLTMVTMGAVGPMASATPTSAAATAASTAPANPLVGTWQRVHKCNEVVQILRKAGFGQQIILEQIVDQAFLEGVTSPDQIADPRHPCRGAVPRKHYHFFTADGQFGSLDFNGQQVDEGTYRIIDDRTVEIGLLFHYRISGNNLRLEVVEMPDCAPQGCFEAVWAVMMPFPGKKWTRVS
jgi:hypothetical protein